MNPIISSIIGNINIPVVSSNPLPFGITHEDARSAAFYAMGKAIKTGASVLLVVDGLYLSSTYTAMTEAWFQKCNLIIMALYESATEIHAAWADRCVLSNFILGINELEGFISEHNSELFVDGPVLFNVFGIQREKQKYEFTDIIDNLKREHVLLYNTGEHINNIHHKYGLLSKYIGSSVHKDVGVLLCSSDNILVDANIFRTRYANGNMRIVILDNGTLILKGIPGWIESNGWRCIITECIDLEIAGSLKEPGEQPTVVIIEKR